MKKSILPIVLAVILSACSTAVPLDTPVVDNQGTSVGAGTGASSDQTGAQSGSGVTTVDLGSASGANAGPANVDGLRPFGRLGQAGIAGLEERVGEFHHRRDRRVERKGVEVVLDLLDGLVGGPAQLARGHGRGPAPIIHRR